MNFSTEVRDALQQNVPLAILPLELVSDHFPIVNTVTINGVTLNIVSWNIMSGGVEQTSGDRNNPWSNSLKTLQIESIQYYLNQLLQCGSIDFLLLQEYGGSNNWKNYLAPRKLFGSIDNFRNSSWKKFDNEGGQWGRFGLITYYKRTLASDGNDIIQNKERRPSFISTNVNSEHPLSVTFETPSVKILILNIHFEKSYGTTNLKLNVAASIDKHLGWRDKKPSAVVISGDSNFHASFRTEYPRLRSYIIHETSNAANQDHLVKTVVITSKGLNRDSLIKAIPAWQDVNGHAFAKETQNALLVKVTGVEEVRIARETRQKRETAVRKLQKTWKTQTRKKRDTAVRKKRDTAVRKLQKTWKTQTRKKRDTAVRKKRDTAVRKLQKTWKSRRSRLDTIYEALKEPSRLGTLKEPTQQETATNYSKTKTKTKTKTKKRKKKKKKK